MADVTSPISVEKKELRARLTAARRARTDADAAAARAGVSATTMAALRELSVLPGCVAAYEPLRTEPGSVELLTALRAAGARVLVPVMLADRDLDWRAWPDGELLGPAAIADASAVLVPALAVGRDGARLGRGGGSYDRALARCRPETFVAALLFDGELLEAVPCEPWDLPVDAAVMPSGWVRLGRNTGPSPAR